MNKIKNKNTVKPLRGFNDWFSADVKLRQFVTDTFKQVFEKYGFILYLFHEVKDLLFVIFVFFQ